MTQRTLSLEISDAAIRRHADDKTVRELGDTRNPYRFRYNAQRSGGSWHVVINSQNKTIWRKAGTFPALTTKALKAALPAIMGRLAAEPQKAVATVGAFESVGDVLYWYEARMSTDRSLSKKRKDTVRSAIKCHLRKRLGAFQLVELTRSNIDTQLLWPLQGVCSLSHTRLVFGVLKLVFKKAFKLSLIESDPVAGMVFSDFISADIRPKEMRFRPAAVEGLLADMAERFESDPAQIALAVMMICHGTRVGETRQARWQDLEGDHWRIPETTTKTKTAHILPITAQVRAFLDRYRKQQQAAGYTGAFLFPARRTGRPISERAASELFARLSAGDWSSHDLRKLARTTWLDLGVDYLIGELLLNHALKDLQAAYIHTHAEAQKRDALFRWHGWLDERGFSALHA